MMIRETPLIQSRPGNDRPQRLIAPCDVPCPDLAAYYGAAVREELPDWPSLSEPEVVRHYTNLSLKNFGVENGTYPLGSCTMKYNPKVHEDLAGLPGFANTHPLQPVDTVQGNLALLSLLEKQLCDITGMARFTFQPSAGAHGELTGLLMIKAWHEDRGDSKRNVMIIPDSAHGTNPASAMMVGYDVREIRSTADGQVDMAALEAALGDDVAGLMLTNPNTLGIFETQVEEICAKVHAAGGLVYYDGANINAILMHTRPGDMGFDVIHFNVHKSFSTPHGGGGPGAGPVGVNEKLVPYLPKPVLDQRDNYYYWDHNRPKSVGKVRAFNGSFGIYVRACAYLLAYGARGLAEVAEGAVANANYIFEKIRHAFTVPYDQPVMHEFVITGERQKAAGCSTNDLAKRLIDYGFHPPTVYFPLIVREAMMVEPTETESRADLDALADAFLTIAQEVETQPALITGAPHKTPIARPDELKAARNPILKG